MPGGDQKAQVSVRLVKAWKEAVSRGIAGELCDRIVFERDPPMKLLKVIYGRLEEKKTLLSRRQRQCLSLTSFGWNSFEIGEFLNISPWTVKVYLAQAKVRLNADTITEAVAIAFRKGEIL